MKEKQESKKRLNPGWLAVIVVFVGSVAAQAGPPYLIPSDVSIGTWEPGTRTYTLNQNVDGTIEVEQSDMTLDGNGYMVSGAGSYGVYVAYKSGVTVKNVTVQGFPYGITIWVSNNCLVTGSTVRGSSYGIYITYGSCNNTFSNNLAEINSGYGISVGHGSNNNIITNNISRDNYMGIYFHNSSGNSASDNTFSGNITGVWLYTGGGPIPCGSSGNTLTGNTFSNKAIGLYIESPRPPRSDGLNSSDNIVTDNTFSGHSSYGVYIVESKDNLIYNNNFIGNGTQARVYSGTGNIFNLAKPDGGNYWDDWTSPDADNDGFVDNPYVFDGGQDDLPLASPVTSNEPPVAICQDVTLELDLSGQATLTPEEVDAGSYDPEGGSVQLSIDKTDFDCGDIGENTVVLTVEDDEGETDTCEATVTVVDNICPTIVAPEDVMGVEQEGPDGTVVGLGEASVWDNCGVVVTNDAPEVFLPGETIVTWTATDNSDNTTTDTQLVEVVDTTAPEISLDEPDPSVLWPPNHRFVDVVIMGVAGDTCDDELDIEVSVEVIDTEGGDGGANHDGDYGEPVVEIGEDGEFGILIALRAERSGKGDGRIYQISVSVTDDSGNTATDMVEVIVPHDKGKGKGKGKGKK